MSLSQAAPACADSSSCQQDSGRGSQSVYTVAFVFPPNQMNWARLLLGKTHSVNRRTSGRMSTLAVLKAEASEMTVESLTGILASCRL
jgi:hypothetical protein